MSLNNVVQFPKTSSSRRRVPMSVRLRHGVGVAVNAGLTVIALAALGVLGVVGWIYGVCQNRRLSGMPPTAARSTDDVTVGDVDAKQNALSARDSI